ncbi:uncharacterized protein [Littorina saxatilis]|uniref:uncharacterized protein n=1 Tax=Littorina saxatilis TaxID=31220 RepID=UPI0038B6758C
MSALRVSNAAVFFAAATMMTTLMTMMMMTHVAAQFNGVEPDGPLPARCAAVSCVRPQCTPPRVLRREFNGCCPVCVFQAGSGGDPDGPLPAGCVAVSCVRPQCTPPKVLRREFNGCCPVCVFQAGPGECCDGDVVYSGTSQQQQRVCSPGFTCNTFTRTCVCRPF